MTKDISTGGGAAVEGNVDTGGGSMTGRDDASHRQRNNQRADPRQTVNVSGEGNQWIVAQILDHGQQIRDLANRLDNIPAEFAALKIQFSLEQDKTRRLEGLAVEVTPEKVTVLPLTRDITIASHTLIRILAWSLFLIVATGIAFAVLFFLGVFRA